MKAFVLLPVLTALSQGEPTLKHISERDDYENAMVSLCGLHNLTQADIQNRIASCQDILGHATPRATLTRQSQTAWSEDTKYAIFDSNQDSSLRIYETHNGNRYCSVALSKGRINFVGSEEELTLEQLLSSIQKYRPQLVHCNKITAGIPLVPEYRFDDDAANRMKVLPTFYIAPSEHCLTWITDPDGYLIFARQYNPQDYCKRDASE